MPGSLHPCRSSVPQSSRVPHHGRLQVPSPHQNPCLYIKIRTYTLAMHVAVLIYLYLQFCATPESIIDHTCPHSIPLPDSEEVHQNYTTPADKVTCIETTVLLSAQCTHSPVTRTSLLVEHMQQDVAITLSVTSVTALTLFFPSAKVLANPITQAEYVAWKYV